MKIVFNQLQCNKLNRGHPTFFSQSQDELRTKESEFVHFGPITNERLAVKSCLFPSTKRRLNIHCWAPRIFKTKTDKTHIHFPMMAWRKKKEIQRKFDLYFQICFPNDLTVARRSRMLTDLHRNVKYALCSEWLQCWRQKTDYISVLDSTTLEQRGA